MIQVTGWNLLFLYLAGFFTLPVLFRIAKWRWKNPPKEKRTWSSISNLEWHWDFDFEFKEKWTGNDIGIETARLMKEQLVRKPMPGFEVLPGKYTVKLKVIAAYVKRE